MLTVVGSPLIASTGGFERPNVTAPSVSRYRRWPSTRRISKPSVDLPDPESPVKTTNFSFGMLSETFFRLCSRALLIVIRGSIVAGLQTNEAYSGTLHSRFGAVSSRYHQCKTLVAQGRVRKTLACHERLETISSSRLTNRRATSSWVASVESQRSEAL